MDNQAKLKAIQQLKQKNGQGLLDRLRGFQQAAPQEPVAIPQMDNQTPAEGFSPDQLKQIQAFRFKQYLHGKL